MRIFATQPGLLLNPLKRLASQTLIYGIPSIAGRFLNYLLTYLYTRVFTTGEFGINSEFYAYSGFFTVLLTFGMETGFFRFRQQASDPEKVFSTALRFLLTGAGVFLALVYLFAHPIAAALHYEDNMVYIYWFGWILALDTAGALPFARLRAENKALQFAGIKLAEIFINIGFNIFFLVVCRHAYLHHSHSWFASLYNPQIGVGYVFISNLIASAVKVIFLLPVFRGVLHKADLQLLRDMLRYSLPMVIIGFAGIINEMLDRVLLRHLLPYDPATNLHHLGVYGACYKLSIIMSLFIQAFRFAAEPFFFAQSTQENARRLYADVLKYFTIFCMLVFLGTMLYLDYVQLFIGSRFREGLRVVPVLLLANMFLGIYVNLSVWYKLTDRTLTGAWVAVAGAVITIVLNILFIPSHGYMASAWATFACYGFMVVVSYLLGQRYYPVNYEVTKILLYILSGIGIWLIFEKIRNAGPVGAIATVLMLLYTLIVFMAERKNFRIVSGGNTQPGK
ncbi:MAG: polysaccharide biosynthesis C-terminal domain-containing protein [Chitinophagales bacterium]|nr:polysaccharide biosynthesis C-terminal domain-containing protein [Chitinophagales bacterium]MDW8420014.1 polysaccharide biosynthesis C-terminal domain-containing protein [Chitinophagales bacterium]